MALCKTCGTKAGWFKSECSICKSDRVEKQEKIWNKISHLYYNSSIDDIGLDKYLKIKSEYDTLGDIIVDGNIKGKELEKLGKIEEAIVLYEKNVEFGFDGSHPYERLRIIYTKKKMFLDVIRVCQEYITYGQKGDIKGKNKYKDIIIKMKNNS